ncbi:ParB/RepB/Spo0J family partition protein [Gordonia amicalis]|uniref:ParB/RepB/Spo0J family partition protein n=1 Tax=Gordonia amicalis TaxID=89053 RepID=UPI0024BBE4C4|nr:ParB/RepB/Spo0J family partition protein [Gordonia amicalis]MDJ0454372.1 ParB/RepB/Spo0J family partition protein [Gordonia amicalis]MDV7077739.1 ParB/RepB/Spo0J family partition protein [Gordonia amicalis]
MTTPVMFQALPPLSPEEYSELERSILDNGVMVPIVLDENGVVIDGHHRQQIAAHHDLPCPSETKCGFTDTEKRGLALSLNLHRRQLTREQKRALVAESIKADPQLSDREHGRRTGVSHPTVATVRDELELAGDVESFTTREDSAGRSQPSTKPRPAAARDALEDPDDGASGEPRPSVTEYISADQLAELNQGQQREPERPQPATTPKRRPITDAFDSANFELRRAVERLVRLSGDDRFRKNKDQIKASNLSDLVRVRDAVSGVINQLEG